MANKHSITIRRGAAHNEIIVHGTDGDTVIDLRKRPAKERIQAENLVVDAFCAANGVENNTRKPRRSKARNAQRTRRAKRKNEVQSRQTGELAA